VASRSPTALLLCDQTSDDVDALAAAQRDRCRTRRIMPAWGGHDVDRELDRAAGLGLLLDASSSGAGAVAAFVGKHLTCVGGAPVRENPLAGWF
jgi:hypothetical protein